MGGRMLSRLRHDKLLVCALIVALFSLLLSRPKWSDINSTMLLTLFSLLLLVKIYQAMHVLDYWAIYLVKRSRHFRQLQGYLILLAFFSAMFLTNDVAIITFVPLLLLIATKLKFATPVPVTLITIAANLGSSFTPFGNPQNLFLLSHYRLSIGTFFRMSAPLMLVSLLLLLSTLLFFKKTPLTLPKLKTIKVDKSPLLYLIPVTLLTFSVVFSLVPSFVAVLAVVLAALLYRPKLLSEVDYGLLLTFVCFFIAVGNIGRFAPVAHFFSVLERKEWLVYLSGLLTSQVISNVPAVVLLAKFTQQVHALFLGVNIGGIGTLLASLANLLAYKQYRLNTNTPNDHFLRTFAIINGLFLIILGAIGYLLLQF